MCSPLTLYLAQARKKKAKLLEQAALGMHNQSLDIVEDTSLFSLSSMRTKDQLEAVAAVRAYCSAALLCCATSAIGVQT